MKPVKVCVASIRNEQTGINPPGCIQDAALQILRRWATERGASLEVSQWRCQLRAGPFRDDSALAEADVVVLLSSNEFTHHTDPPLCNTMPFARERAARTLARFEQRIEGKPIILMTMDREDNAANYAVWHWWGKQIVATLDEADVPLTTQTLRAAHLRPLREGVRKIYDFGYWGAIKLCRVGDSIIDPRGDALRSLFGTDGLTAITKGINTAVNKSQVADGVVLGKWQRKQSTLFREMAQARSTCCFQWPGSGIHLTARYHEAIALEVYPFVWNETYDVARSVASDPWQRVRSAEELADKVLSLRDPAEYRRRFAAVRARWAMKRWSDDRIEQHMMDRLDHALVLASEMQG